LPGLNLNSGSFNGFTLIFASCRESCLLVSWCAGDRCDTAGSDNDRGWRRRPAVEDQGWSSTGRVFSGRMIGRSGDVVCGLHHTRGVRVSWLSLKTKVISLLVVWPQNHWVGFFGLGLKTDSYGLVICASKSPRQILRLCLKTKRAMICRLHHKTDRSMKMMQDTCRDLAACFAWK
jgi:hypothetical protein